MTERKTTMPRVNLDRLEDALVDSVLGMSESELRCELAESGLDPEQCIADIDNRISSAIDKSSRDQLDNARAELISWRQRNSETNDQSLTSARSALERIRAGDQSLDQGLMLAARKGEELSDSEMEALLEALAALDEFENDDHGDE